MTGPMVEVLVGRIGRPHGIGGEVSVAVLSDSPELRFVVGTEFVTEQDGHRGSLRLASVRPDRDRLLATFDGTAGQWRIAEGIHRIALAHSADEPVRGRSIDQQADT